MSLENLKVKFKTMWICCNKNINITNISWIVNISSYSLHTTQILEIKLE